jgi:integrase
LYKASAVRWLLGEPGNTLTAIRVDVVHPHDVTTWLRSVAAAAGAPTAKTARTVLSRVFRFAIDQRWVNASPVRDATLAGAPSKDRTQGRPGPGATLDPTRAMTPAERDRVISAAQRHDVEVNDDLGDLLRLLAGTGVRIGEALALHWDDVDLGDLGDPASLVWVAVGGWTVTRQTGRGLVRTEHGSTKRAVRRLALPPTTGQMMRARSSLQADTQIVFPNPLELTGYREVSRMTKVIRALMDRVPGDDGQPMTWASSHTLRRTIVTELHLAGVPSREIADHTGHRDLRVLEEHYIARTPSSSLVARVLGGATDPRVAKHFSDGGSDGHSKASL